jgi:hypothetical protein
MDLDAGRTVRLLGAAALGAAAYLLMLQTAPMLGMQSLYLAPLVGLAAAILLPRAAGWAAMAVGLSVAVVGHAATLDFAGLWPLALAALLLLTTCGWLTGYAAIIAVRLGIRPALRDRRFDGAVAGVASIAAVAWYVAMSFAADPP